MLKIREGAEEYVAKVLTWAAMNGHLGALVKTLAYLHGYADEDGSGRTIVTIGQDFAEHSFTVTWYRRKPGAPGGEYRYEPWMNGGVIWHASDASWSVHT